MRSYRSVVTLQMNHVVRFSVSAMCSVSLVNYHVVQLFLFPTWGSDSVLLFSVFDVVLKAT